jgi:hypothetical protein
VLVVGLIRKRRGNLVHVELVQVEHPFSVDPEPSVEAGAPGPRAEDRNNPPTVRSDQDDAWSPGLRRQGHESASASAIAADILTSTQRSRYDATVGRTQLAEVRRPTMSQ